MEAWTPDDDTVRRLALTPEQVSQMVHGRGCHQCDDTGYQGRTGVFETLLLDNGVRRAILDDADDNQMEEASRRAGWRPMIERGIELALEGKTTTSEIIRTLGSVTDFRDNPDEDGQQLAAGQDSTGQQAGSDSYSRRQPVRAQAHPPARSHRAGEPPDQAGVQPPPGAEPPGGPQR